MRKFFVQDWEKQLECARSGDNKEFIYKHLRPIFSYILRRHLSSEYLIKTSPILVLPEKGFPLVARRKWGVGKDSLLGKTILVQGTGNGWDVASWAKYRPAKIIGVDLFGFNCWNDVKKYCNIKYKVEVIFETSSLDRLESVPDESIDLLVSDAVFEHINNLYDVIKESYRILKKRGTIYATYGPLWYCAGGDHFSGRGGLANSYNHILLTYKDYDNYFSKYKIDNEDFQGGGRYVELNLFSKLRTEEYLEIFKNCGFEIDELILEISNNALYFKKRHVEMYKKMLLDNSICKEEDFIIKGNYVRLMKR
jgi:ubiquinone/menaquinone biosynthesis C-methylase UbiE